MNTPTSSAPHICRKVLRNTSPTSLPLNLPMDMSHPATMIHAVRIAVPAIHGAKLNWAVIVVLISGALAVTLVRNQLTFGRVDQGPVQAATTTSRIPNGIQACSPSAEVRP